MGLFYPHSGTASSGEYAFEGVQLLVPDFERCDAKTDEILRAAISERYRFAILAIPRLLVAKEPPISDGVGIDSDDK